MGPPKKSLRAWKTLGFSGFSASTQTLWVGLTQTTLQERRPDNAGSCTVQTTVSQKTVWTHSMCTTAAVRFKCAIRVNTVQCGIYANSQMMAFLNSHNGKSSKTKFSQVIHKRFLSSGGWSFRHPSCEFCVYSRLQKRFTGPLIQTVTAENTLWYENALFATQQSSFKIWYSKTNPPRHICILPLDAWCIIYSFLMGFT